MTEPEKDLKDVRLCTDCGMRGYPHSGMSGEARRWCFEFPNAATLARAREKCLGRRWRPRGNRPSSGVSK